MTDDSMFHSRCDQLTCSVHSFHFTWSDIVVLGQCNFYHHMSMFHCVTLYVCSMYVCMYVCVRACVQFRFHVSVWDGVFLLLTWSWWTTLMMMLADKLKRNSIVWRLFSGMTNMKWLASLDWFDVLLTVCMNVWSMCIGVWWKACRWTKRGKTACGY